MGKFVCSVDTRYLPNWGTAEGIREMLQNGRDAEIQHNAKLDVRYRKDTQTLVIKNEGCIMPLKALLIGFSTKREDRRLAGQYGEGLVFGILALVRNGHAVKIRTGSEVWIPRVERHDQVDEDVLVFAISSGNKVENRVQVEIDHVTDAMWRELPGKFLFLRKDESPLKIKTDAGTLILDPNTKGSVYVKGIWVCHDPELACAYDFADCETDRDRKMIDSYNLRYAMRQVWATALRTRPDLIGDFLNLLTDQAKDIEGVDNYGATYFDSETRQKIADDFRAKFDPDAVPVSSTSESIDIEHLGRTGIIVSKALKSLLESVFGTLADLKKKLAKENHKEFAWHELNETEQANLTRAMDLVKLADVPVDMRLISVVLFRDTKIQGEHRAKMVDDTIVQHRIILSRNILENRNLTLVVLVHEGAHLLGGGDGEVAHVAHIEMIWSKIVEKLSPSA